MKTYDSFDGWHRAQSPKHRKLGTRLRKLVGEAAPKLDETSKWGNGCWQKGNLPLVFLHSEPDHLQFGFFAGAMLKDPKKLLRGKGKFVRHIRVESENDIDDKEFATMVRRAVRAPAYK